jgi:hypothetical protein
MFAMKRRAKDPQLVMFGYQKEWVQKVAFYIIPPLLKSFATGLGMWGFRHSSYAVF